MRVVGATPAAIAVTGVVVVVVVVVSVAVVVINAVVADVIAAAAAGLVESVTVSERTESAPSTTLTKSPSLINAEAEFTREALAVELPSVELDTLVDDALREPTFCGVYDAAWEEA